MTLEEMKRKKRERGLTNKMVAELSGVPLGTVQKIFSGATQAPRKETIDALEALLGADISPTVRLNRSDGLSAATMSVREALPAERYSVEKYGNYTNEDYYALPDDERWELIEGELFKMESPTKTHQGILLAITLQLDACVEQHAGQCFLYMAPSDVELGELNNTVVQPDLYIHCDPAKESNRPHHGAPDFALEVISPSNRAHDLWRKQDLYRRFGVKEYWIVDPEKKRVVVYDFAADELPFTYTFEDVVPVRISEGNCSVDFRKVYNRVKHLYEN